MIHTDTHSQTIIGDNVTIGYKVMLMVVKLVITRLIGMGVQQF